MTNMPEAKLAREAELCYATVAMVTDYDCWHEGHGAVTVEQVVRVLLANAGKAKSLVKGLIPLLAARRAPCSGGCHHALDSAIITAPGARDPAVVAKLQPVAGRVLK
jgi:5'-methylthioadenosine phosphorylase